MGSDKVVVFSNAHAKCVPGLQVHHHVAHLLMRCAFEDVLIVVLDIDI